MELGEVLEQLKNVEVQGRDGNVLAVGLVVTLYVEDAHLPERRCALAACFDDYWDGAQESLRWVTQPRPKAGGETQYQWAKASGQDVVRPVDWVRDLSENHPWSVSAHGGMDITDASTFTFEISAAGAWARRLAYVTASWPIGFFEGTTETFRSPVRRWVEATQPLHGYAGLGVLLPLDTAASARAAVHALGLASRFPGLELDRPVYHTRPLADGIKGVNWLTVVGDRLLEKLGGSASLMDRLGKRFDAYRYSSGLVIQAGGMPELGDTNRGLVIELYRQLARELTPVRARFEHSHMKGLTVEQSSAWLARFD